MVKHLTLVEVTPNRCRHSTEALGQRVAADEEQMRQQVGEQATLGLPPEERYWPYMVQPSPNPAAEAVKLLKASIDQWATHERSDAGRLDLF